MRNKLVETRVAALVDFQSRTNHCSKLVIVRNYGFVCPIVHVANETCVPNAVYAAGRILQPVRVHLVCLQQSCRFANLYFVFLLNSCCCFFLSIH